MYSFRLLFDFGHGENTPGKRSPDGRLREYKYVREVGMNVAQHFYDLGIDVSIVVPETVDISLPDRCKRVNEIVKKNPSQQCLLTSIHVNAAGNGSQWMSARGWEIHVGKTASNTSRVFANNIFDAAKALGAKTREPLQTQKYWENNYYILTHTLCPAVLTENYFQDNKEDVDYLLSPEGRLMVENIHIMGISNYLSLPYSLVSK